MRFAIIGDIVRDTAAQVRTLLAGLSESDPIEVSINSEGGDAFAGEQIRAMLTAAPNAVTVCIEGICASAASTVAMAGDTITMTENSALMIHEASTMMGGKSADLASAAQMLATVDAGMAAIYARRSGLTETAVRALMAATTWFTAAEAKEAGLIDEIIPGLSIAAAADLESLPTRIKEVLSRSSKTDTNPPMAFSAALLKKLGLAESATDEQVTAAVDALNAKLTAQAAAEAEAADIAAAQAAAAALTAVSAESALAELHAAACVSAVERYISAGKVNPANRDKAIAACGATAKTLSAVCAYWESAPKIVADPTARQAAPAATSKLSPMALAMHKAAGLDPRKTIARIEAEVTK